MDITKSMGQPAFVVQASAAANTQVVCTFPKPSQATACIYITRVMYSASAAPAAAVEATLTGPTTPAAVAQTIKLEVPANVFAPVTFGESTHPIKCAANTDAVFTLPALGAAVVGSVQIYGYYGSI